MHVYLSACLSVCTCKSLYMSHSVYMYVRTYVCMYVCMSRVYVCLSLYMFVCMSLCLCPFVLPSVHPVTAISYFITDGLSCKRAFITVRLFALIKDNRR